LALPKSVLHAQIAKTGTRANAPSSSRIINEAKKLNRPVADAALPNFQRVSSAGGGQK